MFCSSFVSISSIILLELLNSFHCFPLFPCVYFLYLFPISFCTPFLLLSHRQFTSFYSLLVFPFFRTFIIAFGFFFSNDCTLYSHRDIEILFHVLFINSLSLIYSYSFNFISIICCVCIMLLYHVYPIQVKLF